MRNKSENKKPSKILQKIDIKFYRFYFTTVFIMKSSRNCNLMTKQSVIIINEWEKSVIRKVKICRQENREIVTSRVQLLYAAEICIKWRRLKSLLSARNNARSIQKNIQANDYCTCLTYNNTNRF